MTILENAENIGFTASVNRALRQTKNEDVVLLNADTVVPDGWLDRLYTAAYSAPDIGTVTPLSNNGEIVSFPLSQDRNQIPPGLTLDEIDQITADVNAGQSVDLPTGVGFCMFIKSETLHAVGLLDSFNFGRGYGEETDFCLRARAVGWRSVCATDVFVEHVSKVSFGGEKEALARLNMKRVGKKHPEYSALMGGFLREDPLSNAFRRLERAILSRRTQTSWSLIVAPKDWRTNLALEPLRHAAAISGENILWLYPDDKQRDRLWLTSDTSFKFGRLRYDLDSEQSDLSEDLGHLDITHIHWFEPPATDAILDALCQIEAEQTLYLASSTMAEFLQSGKPLSQQLIASCPNAKACSGYGLDLLETLGVPNREHVEGHAGIPVQDGQSSSSKRDTAEPISIAVVGGFQSSDGVEKLLEVARYAAADNLPVTFYLFANTLHDLALSRTKKVVPLGFVSPEEVSVMIKRLGCDAALSVDMDLDPAPMALEQAATEVAHVFCFEGGARTDLPQTVGNITVLNPDIPSPQLLGSIMNALEPAQERIVCDA